MFHVKAGVGTGSVTGLKLTEVVEMILTGLARTGVTLHPKQITVLPFETACPQLNKFGSLSGEGRHACAKTTCAHGINPKIVQRTRRIGRENQPQKYSM